MDNAGDHSSFRISKHIAPVYLVIKWLIRWNVGMPYSCIEFHFWWFIGIFWCQYNINLKISTFIWCIWCSMYKSFPMCDVIVDNKNRDIIFFILNNIKNKYCTFFYLYSKSYISLEILFFWTYCIYLIIIIWFKHNNLNYSSFLLRQLLYPLQNLHESKMFLLYSMQSYLLQHYYN
jgi:hypothetical protein